MIDIKEFKNKNFNVKRSFYDPRDVHLEDHQLLIDLVNSADADFGIPEDEEWMLGDQLYSVYNYKHDTKYFITQYDLRRYVAGYVVKLYAC